MNTEQIHEQLDGHYDEMVAIRRHLHQHPELSFEETETATYIANFYEKLGVPYEKNVGGNGVVATLKGGKSGKTVALRADFDALPIQDEKDVPYKSTVDGVMHACGHDGHTATLLVLAKVLTENQADLPGTVVFLHQHAEELAPGGAKPMIEAGALEGVDAVFGTHLWAPVKLGTIQTSKDALMAGSDRFEITIQGKGGHGAAPHETKDAIVIASDIVSQLQQIVSRRLNPTQTAVVTVGTLNAGNAFNIIADKAHIGGTVRYLDKDVQALVIDEMEKILQGVCTIHDASYTLDYAKGYPPVINDEAEAARVLDASKKIDGVEHAEEIIAVMGGEDFSYYVNEKPGAYFFTGAQLEGHVYPHHHPMFDFDERALPIAAKTLYQVYIDYQKQA